MEAFDVNTVDDPINAATNGDWKCIWFFTRGELCESSVCFPEPGIMKNCSEVLSVKEFLRLFSKPKQDYAFLSRKKRQQKRQMAAYATKEFVYVCQSADELNARAGALTFRNAHDSFRLAHNQD
jgi:hypothetical protein